MEDTRPVSSNIRTVPTGSLRNDLPIIVWKSSASGAAFLVGTTKGEAVAFAVSQASTDAAARVGAGAHFISLTGGLRRMRASDPCIPS